MEKLAHIIRENRSILSFLGWALLLLVLWAIFTSFFSPQLMALHYSIIAPQTKISSWMLNVLGYDAVVVLSPAQHVGKILMEGRIRVLIGSGCSGLELFLMFAGFILIFRGKARNKIWFVPAGLLIILVLNVLRITALSLILYYAPEYMEFNHKYTFVIIVYGAIFLLWLWWVNRFSAEKTEDNQG